ncbi:MAG: hypothetical protein HY788_08575 [Deltaproteobacteria bacterium]|nr:hypothetical protein [Deltaproteobacteria bacterium]
MKPKLDANGNVLLKDGNPVFVLDDGTEQTFVDADKLFEAKKGSADLQKKLEVIEAKFKGVDPDRYSELLKRIEDAEDNKLRDEKKFDELIEKKAQALKQTHAQALSERNERIKGLEASHRKLLLDNEVLSAATKAGAHNPEKVLAIVRGNLDLVEKDGSFQSVVKDVKGEMRFNKKGDPMSIQDLLGELTESDGYLFKPSNAGGAGSQPSQPASGKITLTREQLKDPAVYETHRDAYVRGDVKIVE